MCVNYELFDCWSHCVGDRTQWIHKLGTSFFSKVFLRSLRVTIYGFIDLQNESLLMSHTI